MGTPVLVDSSLIAITVRRGRACCSPCAILESAVTTWGRSVVLLVFAVELVVLVVVAAVKMLLAVAVLVLVLVLVVVLVVVLMLVGGA